MKNTQEFFQLGVTKPSKSDVQNYLNGLGTRLMQLSDIKKKIITHFKNIKNLKLDSFGRKVLSFEEVEFEEGVDWTKFDTPFGGRHGKKFDSWDEWEKVEKDAKKLEKTPNKKKQKNKTYEQFIKEIKGSTAVFTFGRFNPPTIGHEKLLKVIESTATKNDADQFIFLSQSQDAKKNPLSASQKLMFMKLMFPKQRRAFPTTSARTALEALSELHKRGQHSKVIMVVGSDRVREFDTLLNRYNDVKSKHGYYNFENIDVISAGERDPDAEGAGGMSASKMRTAVQEGKYDLFKMGVPAGVSEKDCHNLYNAVAKGMKVNIKEDMEYTTEDIEEVDSLIEEIDMLCKNNTTSLLREDQMCEFLLLKEAVREGVIDEGLMSFIKKKIPSKDFLLQCEEGCLSE